VLLRTITTITLQHQKGFVYYSTMGMCMARENTIVLSDTEQADLQDTRQAMFGSDEVPYGVVISKLIEHWEDTHE